MKVIILCGGDSSEREISIKSGKSVYEAIKNEYDHVSLSIIQNIEEADQATNYDVAFIALHGSFGESGEIQGRLESLKISYTGPNSYSSKLCYDRLKNKELFLEGKIPTPQFSTTSDISAITHPDRLIIKPCFEGSSVGIELTTGDQLNKTLETYKYNQYIIEEYIQGREFTVGYLGEKLLSIVEIVYSGELFDYNAKYFSSETRYIAPALLDVKVSDAIFSYSKKIIELFKIEHMARIDLKLSADNKPFFLEVNSIPGLTSRSLLPMAAKCMGIEFKDVCKTLIELALNRRQKTEYRR
ncbi:MAG: D-alanine--D-alanine ligase [Planctomycetes bacterium]|nr:D-alanine--D-alanine ligase [Planctomycetota bacterium]